MCIKLLIFCILFYFTACSTLKFENPHKDSPIYLANVKNKKSCKKKKYRQWFGLFGAIPITKISSKSVFKEKNKSFKIERFYDTWDLAITLVLGSLLSVTRESMIVEVCDGKEQFRISKRIRDKEISDLKEELEKKNSERLSKDEEEFRKVHKEFFDEKLVKFKEDYFRRRTYEIDQEWVQFFSVENDPSLYTLIYQNGNQIQGKLVEMGAENIIFEMKGNRLVIKRKEIKKLVYPKEG